MISDPTLSNEGRIDALLVLFIMCGMFCLGLDWGWQFVICLFWGVIYMNEHAGRKFWKRKD